jgi:hypothetical protein
MPTKLFLPLTRSKVASQPFYVETEARAADTGLMVAVTTYRSNSEFLGFHGGAQIYLLDQTGKKIAQSGIEVHGVDGRIGDSVRQIEWRYNFDPSAVTAAASIAVAHTWDPQWLAGLEGAWQFIQEVSEWLKKEEKGEADTGERTEANPTNDPWQKMSEFLQAAPGVAAAVVEEAAAAAAGITNRTSALETCCLVNRQERRLDPIPTAVGSGNVRIAH